MKKPARRRRSRSFWVGVISLCIGVMGSSWLISLIMEHPDLLLSGIALICLTAPFIVAGIFLIYRAQHVEIDSLNWRGRRITEEEKERWLEELEEAEQAPNAWLSWGYGLLAFGLMWLATGIIICIVGFATWRNLGVLSDTIIVVGSVAATFTAAGIFCIRLGKARRK